MKRRTKIFGTGVLVATLIATTGGIASASPSDLWTFQCGEDGQSEVVTWGLDKRQLDTWPTEPRSGGGWLFGYRRMAWTATFGQWVERDLYPSNSCTGPWTRRIWENV